MALWVYLFFMVLLIPAGMVGFGSYFARRAPANINPVFGYRTAMSMKSKETWAIAHQYIGRLWRVLGWGMLPFSAAAMLAVRGGGTNLVGSVGAIVCLGQLVAMVLPIFPTQRALKKHFDDQGNRKALPGTKEK